MADQLVTMTGKGLDRYKRSTLKKLRGQIAAARRGFLNNMAFKARILYIDYGVPRVMTVRNRNILRKTMRVTKATRRHEVATAGQVAGVDRYSTLRAQERGGYTMDRNPANKAARWDKDKRKIVQSARFRGDILDPQDVRMRHMKGRAHRTHVFLEMMQREKVKSSFIIGRRDKSGLGAGMLKLGKKTPRKGWGASRKNKKGKKVSWRKRDKYTYKILTLRTFKKGQKRVKRRRWMKPSNEKLLRQMDPQFEWAKAMRHALKRR